MDMITSTGISPPSKQLRTAVTFIYACGLAITLAGCAEQYKTEEQQAKAMRIHCATAEGDIRMLQQEKVNAAQQAAAGVSMIVPVGLVIGVVTQTEGTKYQVATGEYNKLLDDKIAEIKTTCHLP